MGYVRLTSVDRLSYGENPLLGYTEEIEVKTTMDVPIRIESNRTLYPE